MLPLRAVQFDFPKPQPHRYPWNLPAFQQLDALAFQAPVTFLIGDDGSGQSTFLESVAEAAGFNPEGGAAMLAITQPIQTLI